MSSLLSAVSVAATALLSAGSLSTSREIDNVGAFARLYGVVRFFYPSDATVEVDWNRFAVHGVSRVRGARNRAELGAALRGLVAPLGPGIEIGLTLPSVAGVGVTDGPFVAWRYLGAGFSTSGGSYRAKRTHRAPAARATGDFVTLMQTVSAEAFRGKAIRLRGQVRATPADPSAGAALWLRIDRPNRAMGFFDNMDDRLVRDAEWRPYAIEGTVADDAEVVAFGVMAVGAATADFDEIELAIKGSTGDWTPVPIKDAGFEEAVASNGTSAWLLRAPGSAEAGISRPSHGGRQRGQFLRLAPPPAGEADAELFAEKAPTAGAHADFDLGSGLRARVPLALTDAQARPDPSRAGDLAALRTALAAAAGPSETPDVDQRLADVVVAWSVFRHFYPYWAEAGVDWDRRLRPQLDAARAALTRAAQRDALRVLVADARDGHGFVADILDKSPRADLPVTLIVIDGRLVVASSAMPSEAPVGAVVSTINGTPASVWLQRAMSLASGTPQWRQVVAARALMSGSKGATVKLGLHSGSVPREVTLAYGTPPPPMKRPEALVELEPGLWYVDLTRTNMAQIEPRVEALAAARGVVFDVRGYPGDAGVGILRHLLQTPERDRWMHVAKIVGPCFDLAGWQSGGWDVTPAGPRIAGKAVFLTDGGAISYAESVMGYVADRKLGTIVGETTAGTNGNVASFLTPGGFRVSFTGMRVTRHDGRSQHHLVGIKPDIAVTPTLEGVRAGRDEVLERGLAIARDDSPAR